MCRVDARSCLLLALLSALFAVVPPTEAGQGRRKAELATLARDNNAFAFEVYREIARGDANGNLFLSPYSISAALAMTYSGARSDTAQEMRDTLHFALADSKLHAAFAALERSLEDNDAYTLRIANRLFGKADKFEKSFLELLEAKYGAAIERVSFAGGADAARERINAWVAEATEQKILDLIKPGVVDAETRLVLVNAIYFKGRWAHRFDPSDTRDATFHTADGREVEVPMMVQGGRLRVGVHDEVQVLELPYESERLAMLLMLPQEGELAALEAKLDGEMLEAFVAALEEDKVAVMMPRFTMTSEFRLDDVLRNLGMHKAFTVAADFSGMTGDRSLYIQAVVHKAFVEVNEDGTEAAAATAAVVGNKSAPRVRRFIADRPFLFAIRDMQTGSVLFLGRVADPAH